jgi:hypothetical protein
MLSKFHPTHFYSRLKQFVETYERAILPGVLILGFVFDVVAFQTLDIRTKFILWAVYIIVAAMAIVFGFVYDVKSKAADYTVLRYMRLAMPPLLQFTFGALLSNALLFYWFSGAISVSWPIMVLVVLLMASNEVFRHYLLRPVVQIGVFAFVAFAFFSQLFPYVFRSLDAWVFVLGGVVSSVATIALVMLLLYATKMQKQMLLHMIGVIVSVFWVMVGFYFANVIPPIPLSIRDAGIYHDLVRGKEYILTGEDESFFARLWPGQTVQKDDDGRLYAYTAIYAPTDLQTQIYHVWEFFDEKQGEWITKDSISFSLSGGREEGFRGYTYKTNLASGKWRVVVETARGQVLGRIPFTYKDE